MTRTEILVRGRLADAMADLIASRFSALAISFDASDGTSRIRGELDQAAERALLTLLWDTGHDVTSMRPVDADRSDQQQEGDHGD